MRTIRAALDERTASGGSLAVYRLADAPGTSDIGAALAANVANDRLPPAPIVARRDRVAAIGAFVDFGIIIVVTVATVSVFFGLALVLLRTSAEPGIAFEPPRGTINAVASTSPAGAAGMTPAKPAQVPGPPANSAAQAPTQTVDGTAPAAPGVEPDRLIAGLVVRGDAFFRDDDFASARLFYERAADGGDAQAALRLGATYDPVFLAGTGWHGMHSDPAKALYWYRRAAELGARNTERYVNRLQPK